MLYTSQKYNMLTMDQPLPTLHLTIGLPRGGKSTWSRSTGWPIVNPDSIRLALHGHRFITEAEPMVWAIAQTMVSALFKAGHQNVILDATNTTRVRRNEWNKPSKWKRMFHLCQTPKDVCISRAEGENDNEIIPVIEAMAALFDPVEEKEHLGEISIIPNSFSAL